jgi:hypothetical protein
VRTITVEGYVPSSDCPPEDLRETIWGYALDQRAFGPGRLVVVLADEHRDLVGVAHTPRTSRPELAVGPCIEHIGRGVAAVALCDEPVSWGPPPADLALRLALARSVAAGHGVHLVDWISCDDQLFRSAALASEPLEQWWQLPDR